MSKTVYMKVQISGMVNGEAWPAPGEPFTTDDAHAEELIASGQAEARKPKEGAKEADKEAEAEAPSQPKAEGKK